MNSVSCTVQRGCAGSDRITRASGSAKITTITVYLKAAEVAKYQYHEEQLGKYEEADGPTKEQGPEL